MKVLAIGDFLEKKHKKLIDETAKKAGATVCFCESEDKIPEGFRDAEVVYGMAYNLAKTSKDLKWLCAPFAGVDRFMGEGIFANEDCILTNSAGAYGVGIAEHIIAVSLMMMRRLTEFYLETTSGKWLKPRPQKSLKDSSIVVLGTGDIGCNFARRVRAFEPSQLIGVCRSGKCPEPAFDEVYPVTELDRVLPCAELLVMCLPSTPKTVGILSKERIVMLPEGAYVVNVGRGTAIDENALADALDGGRLAGAALDVFCTEPLPGDSRLWHTKNLLITPHVAGNLTVDYTKQRNVEMFCEDLLNYAQGKPLEHLVDRKLGY